MEGIYKIYGLIDPTTNQLKYIGRTGQRIKARLYAHLYEKDKSHKCNWIKALKSKNETPIIFLIDECNSPEEVNYLEIFYIAYFKSIGCNLTNQAPGGRGGLLGIKQSKEVIEARVIKNTGKKRTDETKKLLSKRLTEAYTEERKRASSERLKKQPRENIERLLMASKEYYNNLSSEERSELARRAYETRKKNGYVMSEETKKKISNSNKGKSRTTQQKLNVSNAMKGKKYPKERTNKSTIGRRITFLKKKKQLELIF